MARVMRIAVDRAIAPVVRERMLHPSVAWYRTTLGRLWRDDSGQALVEYCIVMATLTILMMVAYRNIGTIANGKVNNNVNSLTNSSVVAP